MSETESDVFAAGGSRHPSRFAQQALVVVMNSDDLPLPPSRHLLAEVDVVCFARGPRGVTRDRADGMSRLVVRVPDPVMSTDHGRLLRVQARWLLEDPDSKNGAVIAGLASRCGMIDPGDLFELGHTIFSIEVVASDLPVDVTLDTASRLATLHPELAAAQGALSLIAKSDVPVVIHGETGTGKEVYARALHERSGRSGPMVAVNCGALSASLIEAELFGHRRGAFSGATADRSGFVRAADHGTLFLDEIGELSAAGQIALLRVLQEHEVVPVGDSTPIAVDIRVCAASQRPLAAEVEAGRFRSDLYARLLGYELRLPPLRERPFDIGALIERLVAGLAPNRRITIAPAAARMLVAYDWPLNVRELERCLATALVLAGDRPIQIEHLPEAVRRTPRARVRTSEVPVAPELPPAPDPDAELRVRLAAKLVEHRGNLSAVARDLGKHREQIQRWLRRFGFDRDVFRR